MSTAVGKAELLLAVLLRYGALASSACFCLGLALAFFGTPLLSLTPLLCIRAGIVTLVALPVSRVALTMILFVFEKDFRFALISGTVLFIIVAGFLLGIPG